MPDRGTQLHIELDRTSPVPLYHQMAKAIERSIESGELLPGERLENEIALADRLKVSRPTARRALQEVVDLGMLVRKRVWGPRSRRSGSAARSSCRASTTTSTRLAVVRRPRCWST
ncbi:GntR family transcriptional regulator [Cellulomonas sp. ATA003]|uniref:GntR family transcriptional regulator n=1 Tax=Cellulomonas sp. ATA003 TaxID=3073064 RepID=UPI002873BA3C|nr:GntR family transcriptional regulator [Cellulomonas sp. ATA003]WNB87079.1 GntR family transcriptional regulator [Cellulomonas sp. ATA003]